MTPLEAEVTQMVQRFEAFGLEALRAEWRTRYGSCPQMRSAELLRRLLAWRVQAEALGGLEPAVVRQIISLAKAGAAQSQRATPGTRISREWQGRVHEVEVADGGFLYAGKKHRSLSSVARTITGARWNGPRFFGLRGAGEAA